MIWHVIKKDFKSLWWLGPALIAAAAGYGFSTYYRYEMEPQANALIVALIYALPYLIALMSLARAVQVDSVVTKLGDWHTRPLSRWTILGAKSAITLVGFVLPWGLIDIGWGLYWGMPLSDCLIGSGLHMLMLTIGAVLILTIAASVRITIQFLLSLAGLGIAALTIGLNWNTFLGWIDPSWAISSDVPLSIGLSWTMATVAGLLACLFLLYHRRSVGKARMGLVASTLGLMVIGLGATEAYSRAWRPVEHPATSAGVTLSFDPSQPPVEGQVSRTGDRRGFELLPIPVRVEGLGDRTVRDSKTLVTQTTADGAQIHWHGILTNGRLYAPPRAHPSLEPARLEVRYQLTLLEGNPRTPASLTADGAVHNVAGLGRCRLRVSRSAAGEQDLRCLATRQAGCVRFIGGMRMALCRPEWTPFTPYPEFGMRLQHEGQMHLGQISKLGEVEGYFSTPPVKLTDFITARPQPRNAMEQPVPSPPVNAN